MDEAGTSSGRHPYAHLTTGRASSTIRTLDAFAFPAISPALSSSSSSGPPSALEPRSEVKRRKVADVVSPSSEEAARKRSSFSSIAGLDHVQRERARARRLRKANPKGEGSSSSSSPATYQPFSREHLLSRLSTFTISSYTTKPAHHPRLSPLGVAIRGWSQAGVSTRDEVRCVTCAATCHLESPPAAQSRDDKEDVWSRRESDIVESHKSWCPWRLRGCDASLYRLPIHSRIATVKDLASDTRNLLACTSIEKLLIETPLNEGEVQKFVLAITTALSVSMPGSNSEDGAVRICSLLSLFGWQIALTSSTTPEKLKASNTTVTCAYCARKVGLWSYLSQDSQPTKTTIRPRTFHVAREHRTFCPHVNGSVQAATFLSSGDPKSTTAMSNDLLDKTLVGLQGSELRRMRSRAGSDASLRSDATGLESLRMGLTTTQGRNSVVASDGQSPSILQPPGWSLRLNLVLKRTNKHVDSEAMPPPPSTRISNGANGAESEGGGATSLRKLKSHELLARVRSLMGGL